MAGGQGLGADLPKYVRCNMVSKTYADRFSGTSNVTLRDYPGAGMHDIYGSISGNELHFWRRMCNSIPTFDNTGYFWKPVDSILVISPVLVY